MVNVKDRNMGKGKIYAKYWETNRKINIGNSKKDFKIYEEKHRQQKKKCIKKKINVRKFKKIGNRGINVCFFNLIRFFKNI